ncbi:MAG: isopentenyl-diphosphate delta-isomerase [Pseudomonadota bacterium]
MTIMIPAWVDGKLVPVEKLEAHQRGLKHKAISIFLLSGDHVLLQQRAAGKYHTPLLWANAVCTHPHWEEPSHMTADRRLTEELGVTGVPLAFAGQVEYRADVGGGLIEHEVVDIFVGHTTTGLSIHRNPNEVAATRWTTVEELRTDVAVTPQNFTPWLRIYLAQHADKIFELALG